MNELAIFEDEKYAPRVVFTSDTRYTFHIGKDTQLQYELPDASERWDTWQQFEFQGQKYDLNIYELEDGATLIVTAAIYVVRQDGEYDTTDTSDEVQVKVENMLGFSIHHGIDIETWWDI